MPGLAGLSRGVACEFSRGFCRGFSQDSISLKNVPRTTSRALPAKKIRVPKHKNIRANLAQRRSTNVLGCFGVGCVFVSTRVRALDL